MLLDINIKIDSKIFLLMPILKLLLKFHHTKKQYKIHVISGFCKHSTQSYTLARNEKRQSQFHGSASNSTYLFDEYVLVVVVLEKYHRHEPWDISRYSPKNT